jgi:hypothetical protein
MKVLKVEVKSTVNILVSNDEDIWGITQNALNVVHDKIHFLENDTFYINYDK